MNAQIKKSIQTAIESIAMREVNMGLDGIQVFEACSTMFGHLNVASSINLLDPTIDDLNRAIEDAQANGFDSIIIYKQQLSNEGN